MENIAAPPVPSPHAPFIFNNGLTSKNRFCLAPMTNCQSNINGSLSQQESLWLQRAAKGGFGIIFTCASFISKSAQAWVKQLGIYSDEMIPSLQQLTTSLKNFDSLNIIQLCHGGARCPSALTGKQPVSASAFEFSFPGFEIPHALSIAEIEQIIDDFAQATTRAYRAGFNGIEIHGANGYLVTQFISTQTNLRDDEYGGSLPNRARFARQLIRECRKKVPSDFLIGIRLSPENSGSQTGLDIDDTLQIASWCLEDGANYLNISMSNFLAPSIKYPDLEHKPVIAYFREHLGPEATLIAGGSVKISADAMRALELGADLVYMGTIAIGNPDLPNKTFEHNDVYQPVLPPYSLPYLYSVEISEDFIQYIKTLPMKII